MDFKIEFSKSNINNFAKLLPSKKVKSLYDPILYALMIIGIDIFEKRDKRLKVCRYILRFIYHIITAMGVVTGAFHFGFFCDGFDMDVVFPILYIYTGLLLLFIMNKKRENLLQIN